MTGPQFIFSNIGNSQAVKINYQIHCQELALNSLANTPSRPVIQLILLSLTSLEESIRHVVITLCLYATNPVISDTLSLEQACIEF